MIVGIENKNFARLPREIVNVTIHTFFFWTYKSRYGRSNITHWILIQIIYSLLSNSSHLETEAIFPLETIADPIVDYEPDT